MHLRTAIEPPSLYPVHLRLSDRRGWVSAWVILLPVLALVVGGCSSAPTRKTKAEAPSVPEESALEPADPDRPPPAMPPVAFFLSEYAALELTVSAGRNGSVQKVVISKPSRAKLYDEYTRGWVEKHWKMPAAKPGEPDLRKFIIPIVYPKRHKPPGGHFPAPECSDELLRHRSEGLVIVEVRVAPSGVVEGVRTILSSGDKRLDAYTVDWVRRNWKFPPGEESMYHVPFAYLIK